MILPNDSRIHPSYKQLAILQDSTTLPQRVQRFEGQQPYIYGPFIHPFYYTKQKPQPEPKNT